MKKAILEIDGRRIPVIIDEDNITCSGYERGNVYVEEHKQHITLLPEKDDTPTARELKNQLFDVGLLYSSEKIAKANMRADTLMRSLRQWAGLHNCLVSPKDITQQDHYCVQIIYEESDEKCELRPCVDSSANGYAAFGSIYFKSYRDCEEAIAAFYDELIWYFTEYQAVLTYDNS